MKIGLISDLHAEATEANRAIVPFLIDAIKAAELDVFVLAGDITPKLSEFYEVLGEFDKADLTCQKLFVPGNHDIWVSKDANMTSEQKCRVISEICQDHGFYPLIDAPYIRKEIGFCGTIGWYDYTFASDKYDFSTEQYAEKHLMGTVWSDKRYARWTDTDENVARRFEVDLDKQVAFLKDKVKHIIVVTHHVPFRECIHYRGELPWDYFCAFYGSEGLGRLCLQEPLVTHALFGHVHYAVNQQVENVKAICAPIGYLHEQPTEGLQAYAERSLTCFSLETV
ncbi:MAG: metallophosphoesterase [Candidatus Poribacteria bacterium]|nr:metallophosphoesterase [Candidatus Poribacteria bacterium]